MKDKYIEHLKLLPDDLADTIGNRSFHINEVGCSGAVVYKLAPDNEEKQSYYLKIYPTKMPDTLEDECKVLKWLKGKLPVPEVIYFGKNERHEYILLSEVHGEDAANKVHYKNPLVLVKILAKGLKMVHSISIKDCPFLKNIDFKISRAKINVENQLVDYNRFNPQNRGKLAQELLQEIIDKKPAIEDFVFTHGDYCLPNVFIEKGEISGFIDVSRGGVADRYQDIALCIRSIHYNLDLQGVNTDREALIQAFCNEYGLEVLNNEKVEYYILLDELS